MTKLQQTNNGQYVITIPKQIVNAMGWNKGTELNLKIDDKGRILLY